MVIMEGPSRKEHKRMRSLVRDSLFSSNLSFLVIGAPEILNVKELPLNFLTDLIASTNEGAVVEGQMTGEEEEEKEISSADIEMPVSN